MRNLFGKNRKVKETDPITQAAAIASALRTGNPYAHHWYRQSNSTLVCHKCGQLSITPVFDNIGKCTVHTSHSKQVN